MIKSAQGTIFGFDFCTTAPAGDSLAAGWVLPRLQITDSLDYNQIRPLILRREKEIGNERGTGSQPRLRA